MEPIDLGTSGGKRYRLDGGAVWVLTLDRPDYQCWEYVAEYNEWLAQNEVNNA